MNKKVLSVCLITYNHVKFIQQSIESVLMQKTDFDWEFIIADDCSTDGTKEILEIYQKKYPSLIHLITRDKNVGPAQNFIDLINYSKSKYIAYIEGDDYWIEDTKLQEQVAILENETKISLVHSNVKALIKNQEVFPPPLKPWNSKNPIATLEFGLQRPLAFSCTVVFRNTNFKRYLNKSYSKVKAGEWAFWVILLLFGDAKYIDKPLATYRVGVGVSGTKGWKKNFLTSSYFLFILSLKAPKISQKITLLKWSFNYFIQYFKASKNF